MAVTNGVAIDVCHAIPATHAQGVKLVPVTVTIAGRNAFTSAFVNGAGAVADATDIQDAHTFILIVTNVVVVGIGFAVSTAGEQCVIDVALTIALPFQNVVATTVINGSRPIANPAFIQLPNAFVDFVTNPIFVEVSHTFSLAVVIRLRVFAAVVGQRVSIKIAGAFVGARGVEKRIFGLRVIVPGKRSAVGVVPSSQDHAIIEIENHGCAGIVEFEKEAAIGSHTFLHIQSGGVIPIDGHVDVSLTLIHVQTRSTGTDSLWREGPNPVQPRRIQPINCDVAVHGRR